MTAVGIVAIVAVVLLALVFGTAFFLGGFSVSSGPRQTLDEARAWQKERYDTSFYDSCDGGEYTVEGTDGYILHAKLLRCPVQSDRYVIISHGYTDNRMGALKYARILLDLGFNCIVYDLRGHGLNAPAPTTYGILESRDLMRVIEDTRARYPEIAQLGLVGESLGAATTVSALAYGPNVDFAVADCGFSDIEGVLRDGYRNAGAPVFLVDLADLGTRMRYGFALKDARPIDALDTNEVPILFIHGAADNLISPANSERMHERTKGLRSLHLIAGAGHAESAIVAPDEYRATLGSFLEQLV
ncbi:MAG: alpha/beta hydrolase [Coriobacteriaceae bacterium]|nr:alpha/beta hydrolase [Coriobacteriaceae bacterium]